MKQERKAVKVAFLGALVVFLGLGAEMTFADARDEYKAGLAKLEAQDLGGAAEHFRAAIAERAEERHHLLAARRYYPHYFLGLVLTEQQNCRAGLRSLSESKKQGKIQRSDELFADLEERIASCRQHLAAVETSFEETEGLVSEVEGAGKTLLNLSSMPALAPLWARDERRLATRQKQALDQLESMRQLASTAREAGDLTALDEAKEGLDGALAALRSLAAEARRELGDHNAAKASALEQVEESATQARKTLRGVRDLAPYPPRLAEKVKAVEQLLAEIDGLKEQSEVAVLNDLETKIAEARNQVLAAARRPPGSLAEAVKTFLQGEYQATLDLLVDQGFRDLRATAHACILQAASQFGLHVLAGEKDDQLQRSAQLAARACSEFDPPRSARFLSPRFLTFYEQALAMSEDEFIEGVELDSEADLTEAATDFVDEESTATEEPTATEESTATEEPTATDDAP